MRRRVVGRRGGEGGLGILCICGFTLFDVGRFLGFFFFYTIIGRFGFRGISFVYFLMIRRVWF